MTRVYLTTTIPYVNAAPHLGFALEAVQADVLARHYRQRGDEVRLLSGTDDNSLKNVLAAEAAGVPVRELVDRNADRFAALRGPLRLSYDDFLRTSADPRHPAGVDRLWRACAAAGDLYRAEYVGLYCLGCEAYVTEVDLDGAGNCPEHGVPPQRIAERNWFFRLSRYAEPLRAAIEDGRLRIEPAGRRNEVLSFLAGGLRDFSISRSTDRARGWGIPVPDDPDQVIYVWWDALGNYLTALDVGAPEGPGEAYRRWWVDADRRVHLIGKGVLRFHAVYWPAMLLSAGLPLPTDIVVHDYLTVDGLKISKSAGTAVDPVALVDRYGVDAVRWWLLREVPKVGDADFTVARLVDRADDDLAGGIGNLVNRVVTMLHKYRAGRSVTGPAVTGPAVTGPAVTGPAVTGPVGPEAGATPAGPLLAACAAAPDVVHAALVEADFRRATGAVWSIVEEANRYVERTRPWELARAERVAGTPSEDLDAALGTLLAACRCLAEQLAPFLPDAAARVTGQLTPVDGTLPPASPLFPRIGPHGR